MACDLTTNQEWTIDIILESDAQKRTLVFCILIDGDTITGKVDVMSLENEAVFLSDVTGHNRVLPNIPTEDPNRPVRAMTLFFNWGTTRVVLPGTVFPFGVPTRFAGLLTAFEDPQTSAPPTEGTLPSAPRGNDTGTSTGTQT